MLKCTSFVTCGKWKATSIYYITARVSLPNFKNGQFKLFVNTFCKKKMFKKCQNSTILSKLKSRICKVSESQLSVAALRVAKKILCIFLRRSVRCVVADYLITQGKGLFDYDYVLHETCTNRRCSHDMT